jgi:FOG: WD40-like repeat
VSRISLRLLRRAAPLAVALLAVGCASKGIVHNPAPLKSIAHPKVRASVDWARQVGNGSGDQWTGLRVVAREDAVFSASESGWVYAFAPNTGKAIWSTPTQARVIGGPTVSGDEVLVGTTGGQVIALRRSTGKILWHADASGSVIAAPAVSGDRVVARGVDGRVFAFDFKTGKRLWTFDRGEPNLTLRGQSVPLVVGGQVLIGQDDGKIVAVDLATGKLKWSATLSQPHGRSELSRLNDVDCRACWTAIRAYSGSAMAATSGCSIRSMVSSVGGGR